MGYTKNVWLNDGEAGAIPIDKTNLNEMEVGIDNAYRLKLATTITSAAYASGEGTTDFPYKVEIKVPSGWYSGTPLVYDIYLELPQAIAQTGNFSSYVGDVYYSDNRLAYCIPAYSKTAYVADISVNIYASYYKAVTV